MHRIVIRNCDWIHHPFGVLNDGKKLHLQKQISVLVAGIFL